MLKPKRGGNGASQRERGKGGEREEKTPARKHCEKAGGVRTTTAMHCGFKIFKMVAKVAKFRRLYPLFFNRYSSFLRSFFSIS